MLPAGEGDGVPPGDGDRVPPGDRDRVTDRVAWAPWLGGVVGLEGMEDWSPPCSL